MDASQFYRGAGNNQAMSPTGMPIATMLPHASSSSASSDTVVENTPTPFHRFAGSNQAVADASDAMSLPAADDLPTVAELASSAFFRIASNNRSVDDLAYSESFRTMGKNPVTGVPLSHVYGPARINPYVTGGPYSKSSRTAGKNPFVAAGGAPHRHLSGAAGNNPFVPRVPSSRSSGAGNKPLVPGVPSSQSSGATGNSPFMAGVPDSLSFGAGPDPFVTEASYSQISRTEGSTPFVAETITCSQSSRTAGNSHVSPDAFGNNTSNTNNQEGTHGNRKTNTKTVPDDVLTFFAKMMFVSGETAEPSTETTTLIEEITRQQVIEIVNTRISHLTHYLLTIL
jgi:hypothetical protein